jgi:HAD superfamily hydrolase (TIGR01509 family)
MAQVVLFDILGTVVRDPFYDVMPAFFGMELRELLAVKHPTRWLDFECGLLNEQDFLHGFFADGRSFDHPAFLGAIEQAYAWLPGMEDLLKTLVGQGVPLHALSNYPVWYRRIERQLGLSRFLAWSFVSCETGIRKPDAAAYTGPARTLGIAPQDCLFVDDRPENVSAAKAVGMDALLFCNADGLRQDLIARNLLPR